MMRAFAERRPMKSHDNGPTMGTKTAMSVQSSACEDVIRFAVRAMEISAKTMSSSAATTVTDQVMSYTDGSSGLLTLSDML